MELRFFLTDSPFSFYNASLTLFSIGKVFAYNIFKQLKNTIKIAEVSFCVNFVIF